MEWTLVEAYAVLDSASISTFEKYFDVIKYHGHCFYMTFLTNGAWLRCFEASKTFLKRYSDMYLAYQQYMNFAAGKVGYNDDAESFLREIVRDDYYLQKLGAPPQLRRIAHKVLWYIRHEPTTGTDRLLFALFMGRLVDLLPTVDPATRDLAIEVRYLNSDEATREKEGVWSRTRPGYAPRKARFLPRMSHLGSQASMLAQKGWIKALIAAFVRLLEWNVHDAEVNGRNNPTPLFPEDNQAYEDHLTLVRNIDTCEHAERMGRMAYVLNLHMHTALRIIPEAPPIIMPRFDTGLRGLPCLRVQSNFAPFEPSSNSPHGSRGEGHGVPPQAPHLSIGATGSYPSGHGSHPPTHGSHPLGHGVPPPTHAASSSVAPRGAQAHSKMEWEYVYSFMENDDTHVVKDHSAKRKVLHSDTEDSGGERPRKIVKTRGQYTEKDARSI